MPHKCVCGQKTRLSTLSANNIKANNISTANFIWLAYENWEPEFFLYAKTNRTILPTQLLHHTSAQMGQESSQSFMWVLADQEQRKPLSVATLHEVSARFNIYFFTFSFASKASYFAEALSLLISSIFISIHADLLQVVSNKDGQSFLTEFSWGEQKQVYSPYVRSPLLLDQHPLMETTLHRISADHWWSQSQAQVDLKTLNYLVVRERRKQHLIEAPRKTQNFWQRMLQR